MLSIGVIVQRACKFKMQRIEKPWGYELVWALTKNYAAKILHIKQGCSLSLQYHRFKEETLMVKSGVLTLQISEESEHLMKLSQGDVYHISPGIIHRMSAENGDVEVVEVSTPELDDVVRLQDDYGRTQVV